MGYDMDYNVSELELATQVYESVAQSLSATDTSGAVEAVVEFSEMAQAKVPEQLIRQVKVSKHVADAKNLDACLDNLPRMVEAIEEANAIVMSNSSDLVSLRSTAESLAADHIQ